MFQFGRAGMFEAEYLATLRVHSGHHVLDGAVFPRRVHPLKYQKDSVSIARVLKLLHRAKLLNVFFENSGVLLLRVVYRTDQRRPLLEINVISFPHTKIFGFDLHLLPLCPAVAGDCIGSFVGITRVSGLWTIPKNANKGTFTKSKM